MDIELKDAIFYLYPNQEFIIVGDSVEGLEFVNSPDLKKPTQKQIDDAFEALKIMQNNEAEIKANAKSALLEKLGITADEAALLLQ